VKHVEKRHTIKQMKETLAIAIGASQFILGLESIVWKDEDYAKFATMADMATSIQKSNPTHEQYFVLMVAWGRFFKTLADRIPQPELKEKADALFKSIAEPYGKWFEIKDEEIK